MALERIQKILSRAGISSRRKAEELVVEGLVTINGKVAKVGDKAEFGKDAIKVSGKLIQGGARPPLYLAFNKPRGVISMFADPEGRPTLNGYFTRITERLFPVGRLDFMSEGLILVTNDGDFAERVQKSAKVPRVYRVKVKGRPDPALVSKISRPTRVEGKLVHPHSVKLIDHLTSKSMIEVVLIGAGAIDLKALFERNGVLVDKITRTSIGQVTLRGMAPGTYRSLTKSQVEAIITNPELALHTIEQEQEKAEKNLREPEADTDADDGVRPFAVKRAAGSDRPRKSFGSRSDSDRPRKSFGAPRPDSDGPRKSYGPRADSDRPRKSFGAPRPDSDRPRKSYGPRADSDRPRKSFGAPRPDSDRPRKSYGPRADSDRPRKSFGAPRSDSDRPRKTFGGDRPRGGFGGPRSDSDRPRSGGGKSFGARRGGPRR